MNVTHLECSLTGERYEAGQVHNLSRAGKPLLVRYDLEAGEADADARKPRGARAGHVEMARAAAARRGAGQPRRAARRRSCRCRTPLGGPNLLVKDEGRLPTGSFKARGLAMAVTMAKQFGIERIAMPTNGNAGAALAAYGARAGIETIVICPAETPAINVTETAAYGARVYVADGQIDECGALVGKGAAEGLWFDCSTLKEPYRLEGKKVMGFELAEQLGWELPDAIFYPTGGGTGLIGMWKAFDELEAVGLIGSKRPRMYAVQAEGCAPMVRAFERGRRVRRALGECGDGRDRHSRAQGGRRLPDPARGARERRRGDRRVRRGDPAGGRGRRARRRLPALPRRRRGARRRGARRWQRDWSAARRARAAVQLRERQQISAAGPVEAAEAGRGEIRRAL